MTGRAPECIGFEVLIERMRGSKTSAISIYYDADL